MSTTMEDPIDRTVTAPLVKDEQLPLGILVEASLVAALNTCQSTN